jgi:hypothetical protein
VPRYLPLPQMCCTPKYTLDDPFLHLIMFTVPGLAKQGPRDLDQLIEHRHGYIQLLLLGITTTGHAPLELTLIGT